MTRPPARRSVPDMALALAAACVMAACGSSNREPSVQELPAVNVEVATATLTERAEQLDAGGIVAASETAVMSSRVLAPVVSVAVRAGDRVRAGDMLVRLDARDMTAHVRQADAAIRAAEQALASARSVQTAAAAEHKLAVAFHARIAQLRERNSATAQEFDEADARLAAAAARATATQAGVEQATAQLVAARAGGEAATIAESYAAIGAPFDGVVTERFIDPGNMAAPGQPLLRIDASGQRRVDVRIDEGRAGYIHIGDSVVVFLDESRGGTGPPLQLAGLVLEVARAVAADQRAFTVKVSLPMGENARAGSFARVRFAGERHRVVMVPTKAIRAQGQLTAVFVVANDTARLRLVQTGAVDESGTEIVAGLDNGEVVVISPAPELTDGRAVTARATTPGAAR